MKKFLQIMVLMFLLTAGIYGKTYKIAWSHYTGWEPWGYAKEFGIVDKWAKKYGVDIEVDLINDYIESINLYTSGEYDACTMTNMDALTIPGVGGVDSIALIVGDFSNGNDGIVARNANSVKDLKGREIRLVELSVSHYLLARALEMNGMSEKDVNLQNTSDSDIGSIFLSDKSDKSTAVTWNPILMKIRNSKDANLIFDSSKIPGEVIDILLAKTDSSEEFKKACIGIWYETMEIMYSKTDKSKESISFLAEQSGSTVAEFKAQLKTTEMYYNAKDAVKFTNDKKVKETMDYVRTFSFEHGLYGEGADSKDLVGIEFNDGSVLGDKNNIQLRFSDKYMKMYSDGLIK